MQKRGLSEIVVSIIMILLVLVAIGIIWAVVANLIQNSSDEVSLSKLTANLEIEKQQTQVGLNEIKFYVKRNAGRGEVSGMKFIVSNGTNSFETIINKSLNELETSVYFVEFFPFLTGQIKDVKMAPVLIDGGSIIQGNLADTQELTDNLVAPRAALYSSYSFNTISAGKTPDALGKFNGSIFGSPQPTIVNDASRGNVIDLSGVIANNQYLDLGNMNFITDGAGQYSVSVWVNTRSVKRQWIFGDEQNANDGVILETDPANKIESWNGNPTPGPRLFDYTLLLNDWTHLVLLQNASGISLYVDGNYIQHTTWSGVTTHSETGVTTTVGKWPLVDLSQHRYFDGKIDNLHVFNRALTEQEVKNIYNSQK